MTAQARAATQDEPRRALRLKWLGHAAPLALSYGIGLWTLLVTGNLTVGVMGGPRGVQDPGSLRRVLPEQGNTVSAYRMAPVFAAEEWEAVRAGGIGMEVYSPSDVTLSRGDARRRVLAASASDGLFSLLGARLLNGRFLDRDDATGVLLSERMAREFFGDATGAVGSTLRLDGTATVVVGVLAQGFLGIDESPVDAWQSLGKGSERIDDQSTRPGVIRQEFSLSGLVRIATGNSPQTIAERVAQVLGGAGARVQNVRLATLADSRYGGPGLGRRILPFVLLLCGAVVALAIANCWLLASAWNMARAADLRIRFVVGAPLRRLRASAGGVPVATQTVTTVVVAFVEPRVSQAYALTMANVVQAGPASAMEIAFAAVVVLLASVAASALATERALGRVQCNSRASVVGGRSRARGLVVAAYVGAVSAIAVASVPIVAANLAASRVRPGFTAANAIVVTAALDYGTRVASVDAIRSAVASLEILPYVTVAAASSSAPFRGLSTGTVARGAGNADPTMAHLYAVVGDVIGALGIEIQQGELRPMARPADGAVVTRALATRSGATLGECVYVFSDVCSPLTAIVSDMNSVALGEPPFPTVFSAMPPIPVVGSLYFIARSSHRPTGRELGAIESLVVAALPLASVRAERFEDVIREQTAYLRTMQAISGALFALAAALALVGIHTSIQVGAATRRRELGIRAAIGATRPQLIASVLAESAAAAAVAAALGVAMGLLAARALAATIVGVGPANTLWQLCIGIATPALVLAASAASAVWTTRAQPAALLAKVNSAEPRPASG